MANIKELTKEQYGPFLKYIEMPTVTDIDYNGHTLWITDQQIGTYRADDEISEKFVIQFTHDVSNAINKPFNQANSVLEADTKDLRISCVHKNSAPSGIVICVRKSPPVIRNTIRGMVQNGYCDEKVLHLLINCVKAKNNIVFGGVPGTGKTECAKFFMQFISPSEKVITMEDNLEMHYGDINPESNYTEFRISKDFSYEDAIKASLRLNPKWLMLSEARSREVEFLIEQWSTGVHGFSTIHLEDIHNLPDRVINMMGGVKDPERMENRIYRAVNIGILIRCIKDDQGHLKRYIEQLGFYSREHHKNSIYMIVDEGEIVGDKIPEEIQKKFRMAGIKNPFHCDNIDYYLKREEMRNNEEER